MKKIIFYVSAIIIGLLLVFGFRACVNKTDSVIEAREKERAQLKESITPLTEKEAAYWAEIYAAAIRRGVWNPEDRANSAILELRKLTGGAE